MGILPNDFYDIEQDDYGLLRKGYGERLKYEQEIVRFQTALICEAFVGKGAGTRFVMGAWKLEEGKEVTPEVIKAALEKKRKSEALKRYNGRKSGV